MWERESSRAQSHAAALAAHRRLPHTGACRTHEYSCVGAKAHRAKAHRAKAHRAKAHRAKAHRAKAHRAKAHRAKAHQRTVTGNETLANSEGRVEALFLARESAGGGW